jgi:hypothetical protein
MLWLFSVVSYSKKIKVLRKVHLFISSGERMGRHLLRWVCRALRKVTWKVTVRPDIEPLMGLGQILVKGDDNCYFRGLQIFRKSRSHFTILSPGRGPWSKFHIEDPPIVCATVQNLVARPTWRLGIFHPCVIALLVLWPSFLRRARVCLPDKFLSVSSSSARLKIV